MKPSRNPARTLMASVVKAAARRGSAGVFPFPPRSGLRRLLASVLLATAVLPQSHAGTPAQLQRRLTNGEKVTIIDVRSPTLYARDHIPGAINIPVSLSAQTKLPALGAVVVYDSGLGSADAGAAQTATTAFSRIPGISAEILEGGYAAWESAHLMTTKGKSATREALHYVTYAQLKAANSQELVLVDLRHPTTQAGGAAKTMAAPLTDLAAEFPGARIARGAPETSVLSTGPAPLVVFIDNGDGTAEAAARLYKAGGSRRYAVLAGGEVVLARKGQSGLQRTGNGALSPSAGPTTARKSN